MPKALCYLGYVVAACLLIFFGLDMAIGIPFGGVNAMMDGAMLGSAVALGYSSWNAVREQV